MDYAFKYVKDLEALTLRHPTPTLQKQESSVCSTRPTLGQPSPAGEMSRPEARRILSPLWRRLDPSASVSTPLTRDSRCTRKEFTTAQCAAARGWTTEFSLSDTDPGWWAASSRSTGS